MSDPALRVALRTPFSDLARQRETGTFGMWVFLASELLLFGPPFLAYSVYRGKEPAGFALAAQHTLTLAGIVNTLLLITGSFLVALAVEALPHGHTRRAARLFDVAALLGLCFLGIKALEYHAEFSEHLFPGTDFDPALGAHSGTQLFFVCYFIVTALHSVHVLIGSLLLGFAGHSLRSARWNADATARLIAFYEHFVTAIWLLIFPLFYLSQNAR